MPVYLDKKTKTWYFSTYKKDNQSIIKRYVRRGYNSKAEAKKAEAKFIASDDHKTKYRFDKVAKEFLLFKKNQVKLSSYKSYEDTINKHFLPFFKTISFDKITYLDILSWQNYILSKKYKFNTNHRMFVLLRSLFDYIEINYGYKNPCKNIGNFKNQEVIKEMEIVPVQHFDCFISYIKNNKYKLYFLFIYLTGVRKGEAMALQWKDIIDKDRVYINKSYGKTGISSPKTNRSIRYIYLAPSLKRLLMYYYKRFKIKDLDYYVFGGKKPPSNTHIDRIKNQAIRKSGVKYFTTHQLRHTYISYMMSKTNDVSTIANSVGHSKEMLFNTYLHSVFNPNEKLTTEIEKDVEILKIMENMVV